MNSFDITSSKKEVDVAIIGGGLSGLSCALLLCEAGKSVRLLEARKMPGGRIRSVFDEEHNTYQADLGPTWVWPAFQPLVTQWIEKLELDVFDQFEQGNAVLDYGVGHNPEIRFIPGQDGNVRIQGGSQAIIDSLVKRLPDDVLQNDRQVAEVTIDVNGIDVHFQADERPVLRSKHVVVAVPPRIAAHTIRLPSDLSPSLIAELEMTPTWMAPHAKVVALYDEPFWRKSGLSGRIASREGPIVEGHDHCGVDGSPAVIFGFIGWPHDRRFAMGDELERQVRLQLERCFGQNSPAPRSVHIEDWAADPHVSSPADLNGAMSHPDVRPGIIRQPHADGRLWFASSETAERSPGLIEGAFDAAGRVASNLLRE